MKKYLFIAAISLLFILRFFIFISTQDVGVEHDSGWYLGVARNVAERGIYASYTNTINTTEKPGGSPSIHGRFSVQDKNGFVYLPAGVTAGPGYVLPEALFLKAFGYGWMQYRMWPFIGLCLLLPVLFLIVLRLGGIFSLIFFQLWLWFYPQLLLNQSYESLSEHIALLFLLLGYLLYEKIFSSRKWGMLVLSGLCLGIAVQTKVIYSLGLLAPLLLFPFLYKAGSRKRKIVAYLLFICAVCLPTVLFELYRFIVLFSQFGKAGYWANIVDLKRTFVTVGSGIKTLGTGFRINFIINKLALWRHVGVDPYLLAWPMIFFSGVFVKKKSLLFWTILISVAVFFFWFGFASQFGWFRHILPGVFLGMIVISVSLSSCASLFLKTKKPILIFIFFLFIAQVCFGFISNPRAVPNFILTKGRMLTLFFQQSPNTLQGPLSHAIFSKQDQDGVATALKLQIKAKKRICFSKGLLVAEIPPLVDSVFFPLERCGQNDILIIGPYQKGKFSLLEPVELDALMKKSCAKNIFSNNSYTLCLIQKS